MGIGQSELQGRRAIRSPGDIGAAAAVRVQSAGDRQHGVGICNSELQVWEAICSCGCGGAVAAERIQWTESGQYGMGIGQSIFAKSNRLDEKLFAAALAVEVEQRMGEFTGS
jgi:hypothetical protein